MEPTLLRLDTFDIKKFLGPDVLGGRPRAFYFQRIGGMGDVVMALGALAAVRARHPEARICLLTDKRYGHLARLCPSIDEVFTESGPFEVSIQEFNLKNFDVRRCDLSTINFGINRDHEINAFLEFLDIHAPSGQKEARIQVPAQEKAKAREKLEPLLRNHPGRRIVLHPGQGDANRTWSVGYWNRLVETILAQGNTPVVVGDSSAVPFKGVLKLAHRPGILDLTNRLSLIELVELMGLCDVFVSTDSGPVQLAGLTDIGIVGIYTTVRGRCRLPFRHGMAQWRAIGLEPACPLKGCYMLMLTEDHYHAQLQEAGCKDLITRSGTAINAFMGSFCAIDGPKYSCLKEITPEAVWDACARLLDVDAQGITDLYLRASELVGSGEAGPALDLLETCEAAPWNSEALLQKAIATALLGRAEDAIRLLVDLIKTHPSAEALNLLGLLIYHSGDPAKGAEFFEAALTWNGAYLPVRANLAVHRATEALIDGSPLEGLVALEIFDQVAAGLAPAESLLLFPAEQAALLRERLVAALAGAS